MKFYPSLIVMINNLVEHFLLQFKVSLREESVSNAKKKT